MESVQEQARCQDIWFTLLLHGSPGRETEVELETLVYVIYSHLIFPLAKVYRNYGFHIDAKSIILASLVVIFHQSRVVELGNWGNSILYFPKGASPGWATAKNQGDVSDSESPFYFALSPFKSLSFLHLHSKRHSLVEPSF
jgi:hypothetical protein